MRHPDTKSLRETMKGHMPQEREEYLTDQQEQVPMPPVQVVRGSGETLDLPERDVSVFPLCWRTAAPAGATTAAP